MSVQHASLRAGLFSMHAQVKVNLSLANPWINNLRVEQPALNQRLGAVVRVIMPPALR